ncbi:hypothetical protein BSAF29S_01993 [Bacillus safensis subsp. safensis]
MTTSSQQSKSHFYLPFVLWSKNIFQENKRFDVIPFQSLHSDQDWQNSRVTYETDVYLQSYYMIYELVQLYGRDIIHEIMEETAKTGQFASGFEQATGERLTDFEEQFKMMYQRKNG